MQMNMYDIYFLSTIISNKHNLSSPILNMLKAANFEVFINVIMIIVIDALQLNSHNQNIFFSEK